jgi:uncharacterized membrane protein
MSSRERRRYIDWTRGLAVLVMIEAHTFDAWTRLADRSTPAYRNLIILGGFAAPLFLWLAGMAAVLGAESALRRTGDRRAASLGICRRGLVIFLLAFLFRVQAFVVSPGNSLVSLLRVDILNIMGPAIVVTAVVWGLCRRRSTLTIVFAVLAIAVAMLTPPIRVAQWVNGLPVWVQWYVRPAAEHTVFTAFPWVGFVFAGGAMGALLAGAGEARSVRRLHLATAVVGAALVALGFYTASRPPLYRESFFWTSSPTYFAIRVGVMMLTLALIYGFEVFTAQWDVRIRPVERLGRSSLFIYWIHVELVYGYASWPLRRHLHVYQTAIAYGLFCLLMYGAVVLRDHVLQSRRPKQGLPGAREAATA